MEKRIVITCGSGPNGRYYVANFKLTEAEMQLGGASQTADDKLLNYYGPLGGDLCIRLKGMMKNYPIGFELTEEYLHLKKNMAVDWNEVEPQVLAWLREIYGNFTVRRDNVVRRIANWFRWNFSK